MKNIIKDIIFMIFIISTLAMLLFIIIKAENNYDKQNKTPIVEYQIEMALAKLNISEYKIKIYPSIINYACNKYSFKDWKTVVCMIMVESYFDEYAVGDSLVGFTKERARGIMQHLPSTMKANSERLGFKYEKYLTEHNPISGIISGTYLLSDLDRIWGGDLERVVKSYILGASNLRKYYEGNKRVKILYQKAMIDESWERFQKFYNSLEVE